MLLGIIEPDGGSRTLLGRAHPRDASDQVGYLPEERGLYPAMKAREAIAFLGALRGLDFRSSPSTHGAICRIPRKRPPAAMPLRLPPTRRPRPA